MRLRLRRPPAESTSHGAGPAHACNAPFSAIRLAPSGEVLACGPNSSFRLGVVGETTLLEIWNGEPIRQLRDALDRGDFSLGCEVCGQNAASGKRSLSHAATYDQFPRRTPIGMPRRIEFALTNMCNLQCIQCNGDLSSAIRSQREHRPPLKVSYGESFFDDLRLIIPELEVTDFIGGEPFLTRECHRVWDLMIELGVSPWVHVTTNGTIWNDKVEYYLHQLKMNIALSIDGVNPETQASIRVGSDLAKVRENRDRFLATVRSYGGEMTLNYCVMPQNWQEYLPFLLEADELGVVVLDARVLFPTEFSLFSLPIETLREVVRQMTAQGEASADQLRTNRHVWDDTLADLTTHLERREREEVRVSLPRPKTPQPDPSLKATFDEFVSESTGELARLVLTDGVVSSVEAPEWAGFLGLDACVGVDGSAILATLQGNVAEPISMEMESLHPRLMRSVLTIDYPDHQSRFEMMSLEMVSVDIDGSHRAERTEVVIRQV